MKIFVSATIIIVQLFSVISLVFANAPYGLIDRVVKLSEYRQALINEYSLIHYGRAIETIEPKAVVVHWTATSDAESVYRAFYSEEVSNPFHAKHGKLNVGSHFLVDRNGMIYRLTPETMLNRHAIGFNWCSIGIENVGGENGNENLTNEQLDANVWLIKYLKEKYPTIKYVLGHYQQDQAAKSELWIENVAGYYSGKIDPGSRFMKMLWNNLDGLKVHWFEF